MIALDLFAGTGHGVALARLGIPEHAVELAEASVATRALNGLSAPVYRDVWDGVEGRAFAPPYSLLVGSPPCQPFSTAGEGKGRAGMDGLVDLVRSGLYRDPAALRAYAASLGDDRIALSLTPLIHVHRDAPLYVVLEQVPPALRVWEAYAEVMRRWGYSVWTGILNAENYGVPQTRRRAFLIARADGIEAAPPTPTHSTFYPRDPERLDPGVERWVSMAEALGWGMTRRPSMTVTGGGASTGGAEPFGRGARDGIRRERDAGRWMLPPERINAQTATPYDPEWPTKRPSLTIAGRGLVPHPGATANRHNGSTKSRNDGVKITLEEAAALQSYPPGFRFAGSTSAGFLHVGNAVPPLLSEAVFRTLVA